MQSPGQPPGFCSLHDVYAAHANTGFLTFQAQRMDLRHDQAHSDALVSKWAS
jgi:hypothetical protein